MCEIFAMSSAGRRRVEDKLKEFYSHSSEHPNGWGLMVSTGGLTNIEKEPLRADQSEYLKNRLEQPISGDTVLAHIRYATMGEVTWPNCHPFAGQDISGRQWILIHNGTIFDYPPCDKYVRTQEGQTDSERILLYLLDQINGRTEKLRRELNMSERFCVLENIVNDMSPKNKLNLLIYDGEVLYGHRNMRSSLYCCEEEGVCIISTRALTGGRWEETPFLRLFAYRNGQLEIEGKNTSEEYREDKQSVGQLYLAYSGL